MKVTVPQVVAQFPAFYLIWMYITLHEPDTVSYNELVESTPHRNILFH
jgi:hypothetical protein